MDGWMERQLPHLQTREPGSASQPRPVPAPRTQGPKLSAGLAWREEAGVGRVGACRPGLPSQARRASRPARPRGSDGAHSPPRAPEREQEPEPGRERGPDPPPGDLSTAAPSPARGPNGPGRRRRGPDRPRTLRKRPERFPPAAPDNGAECPPREGRGEQPRRRACGRGWGRGGLPVSLAAARAATHPAPPTSATTGSKRKMVAAAAAAEEEEEEEEGARWVPRRGGTRRTSASLPQPLFLTGSGGCC